MIPKYIEVKGERKLLLLSKSNNIGTICTACAGIANVLLNVVILYCYFGQRSGIQDFLLCEKCDMIFFRWAYREVKKQYFLIFFVSYKHDREFYCTYKRFYQHWLFSDCYLASELLYINLLAMITIFLFPWFFKSKKRYGQYSNDCNTHTHNFGIWIIQYDWKFEICHPMSQSNL